MPCGVNGSSAANAIQVEMFDVAHDERVQILRVSCGSPTHLHPVGSDQLG